MEIICFIFQIFCTICGSKDVTLQNDIILCDGACDRGFHQNCLNPPLLTEDSNIPYIFHFSYMLKSHCIVAYFLSFLFIVPPGDVGWFCPACVCKIDCIDALNELQGSKLSVHDSWEVISAK